MKHRVIQCLNQSCGHVFVNRNPGTFVRCTKCGNTPCRTLGIGGIHRFPLKKAKKIAKAMRDKR